MKRILLTGTIATFLTIWLLVALGLIDMLWTR